MQGSVEVLVTNNVLVIILYIYYINSNENGRKIVIHLLIATALFRMVKGPQSSGNVNLYIFFSNKMPSRIFS